MDKLFSKSEKSEFKKKIYDVDNIFQFYQFSQSLNNEISKYLNTIFLINHWNEWLFYFKYDFQIPLYSYWHLYKKEKKIKINLFKKKTLKNERLTKLKNVYFRQFIYAFFSFIDKLKNAYAEIYNFSIKLFASDKTLFIDDKLFLQSKQKDNLLSCLTEFKNFLHSKNLKYLKEIRNQEIHNICGKTNLFMPNCKNKDDWFREPVIKCKGITDDKFLEILKDLLKNLDDQCTNFNKINYYYCKYLSSIKIEGTPIPINKS